MNEIQIDVSAGREKIEDPEVYGVTANVTDIAKRTVEHGRYFTEWEEQHSANTTVLGYEIAQGLFPNLDPIGKTIHINNRRFQVIGVLKKYGTFLSENRDKVVEIPISTFQKVFGKDDSIFIMVKVDDVAQMAEAQDQARVVLRSRHHRRYNDDDGFAILTTDALINLWRTFTAGAFAAMIGISSIALVVGGIVIMNIMLVSVVERTSEIGLRKAMGARSRDIRRQFLLESILLAASGGIIGVSLGAAAAKIVSMISSFAFKSGTSTGDCRINSGVFCRSYFRNVACNEGCKIGPDCSVKNGMKKNLYAINEALAQAFYAIRSNKLRSFLTILGIVIGVMTVIGMVAIIQGLNSSMMAALQSMGPHLVQFQKRDAVSFGRPTREQRIRPILRYEDALAIRAFCPAIKSVSAEAYYFDVT